MAKKEPSHLTNEPPPFWESSVIFLANIFSLFFGNQNQIQELHEEVGALETYGGRMIPILNLLYRGPNNLLVLEAEPDYPLLDYFQSLGLTLPALEVYPPGGIKQNPLEGITKTPLMKKIRDHGAPVLNGYVTDSPLENLAREVGKETLSSRQGCYEGNNKRLLHQFLKDSGLPIFDTDEAGGVDQVMDSLAWLKRKGYKKAVIKSQIGASGIGMKKIDLTSQDMVTIPEYLFHEGQVLVQGWLDESIPGVQFVSSPSVLLFVHDEGPRAYDMTEQILSAESVHEGNISPPGFLDKMPEIADELKSQALKAGEWLKEKGYRGTASVDYLLITRDGAPEARICEINARVTGATYPSLLAKTLAPGRLWILRNVRMAEAMKTETILERLTQGGLLFTNEKGEGALPFNLNSDSNKNAKKGQFVFIGPTREKALEYLNDVIRIFGNVDRD